MQQTDQSNLPARWALRFVVLLSWLFPIVVAYMHRMSEALVPAMGVGAALGGLAVDTPRSIFAQFRRFAQDPLAIFSFIFIAYIAASIAWSIEPAYAAITFSKTLAVVLLALALCFALVKNYGSPDLANPIAFWLAVTVAIGIVACTVEIVTDGVVSRAVYGWRADAQVNGGIAILALLIWPCLGFLFLQKRYVPAAVLWFLAGIFVLLSPSGASKLSYAAASAIAVLAFLTWRYALLLAVVAAQVGLLIAPFLGRFSAAVLSPAVLNVLDDAHPVERIRIWLLYGELVSHKLLFGWGFAGARLLGKPAVRQSLDLDLEFYKTDPAEANHGSGPLLDIAHSHNIPLQIWVEFGLVGAALAAILIAIIGLRLKDRSGGAAPFLLASAVAIYGQCYVSYSLWETWWFSALAFVIVLSVWLSHIATKAHRDEQGV